MLYENSLVLVALVRVLDAEGLEADLQPLGGPVPDEHGLAVALLQLLLVAVEVLPVGLVGLVLEHWLGVLFQGGLEVGKFDEVATGAALLHDAGELGVGEQVEVVAVCLVLAGVGEGQLDGLVCLDIPLDDFVVVHIEPDNSAVRQHPEGHQAGVLGVVLFKDCALGTKVEHCLFAM